MNLFASINEGLKTVHRNYQILFLHFSFLFLSFFGLFFVLSIPLGILFVVFGIDLTDILKGSFIEILFSSIKLFKKFLIFALILSLTLLIYIFLVIGTWVYLFSGTLGVMFDFLSRGEIFRFSNFHSHGKKHFWKVFIFTPVSIILLVLTSLILGLLSDLSAYFVKFIKPLGHSISVFFSVFLYLSIMIIGLSLFISWITLSLFGYFSMVTKDMRVMQAFREAKGIIFSKPNTLVRALLLFVIYLLTGGFILSLSSLFALIPSLGAFLVAIYHIVTQFAHVYITMVLIASFFSYYLKLTEVSQEATPRSDTSKEVSEQDQPPPQEEAPQRPENQSSREPS